MVQKNIKFNDAALNVARNEFYIYEDGDRIRIYHGLYPYEPEYCVHNNIELFRFIKDYINEEYNDPFYDGIREEFFSKALQDYTLPEYAYAIMDNCGHILYSSDKLSDCSSEYSRLNKIFKEESCLAIVYDFADFYQIHKVKI